MTKRDLRHGVAQRIFRELRDLELPERRTRLEELDAENPELHAEIVSRLAEHDERPGSADDENAWRRASTSSGYGGAGSGSGGRIGAYRIVREIGRGGMGVVHLGERVDEGIKEFVAIKVMKRGLDTEQLLHRFRQERQILSGIRHPGVAGFLDAGETEDGRLYFVMQHVDGLPLDAYCDAHRLDVDERLRLFQGVCEAVECVNRHLIVHRDLKPQNILVTEAGQPKLLDFGIAKFLNPDLASGGGPPTGPESRVMTPEYASPEQVRGHPLTTASDVYSLGVLLYEILCGHPPYRLGRDSRHEVVEKVCECDPAAPSTAVGRTEPAEPSTGPVEPITPDTVGRARHSDPTRLRRRPGPVFDVGSSPVDLANGDLDSDGLIDLVTANDTDGTLSVLFAQGGGAFDVGLHLPIGETAVSVVTADFDLDGGTDVAAIATAPGIGLAIRVRLKTNTIPGNHSFDPPLSFVIDASPAFLATADFNDDGEADLVTANLDAGGGSGPAEPGSVTVLLNDTPALTGSPPCPGDADGDGEVGFSDLLDVLSTWGPCPPPCPPDLDGDGEVGFSDLLEVLSTWGDSCG